MSQTDSLSAKSLDFQVPDDLTSTNAETIFQEINAILDSSGSGWTTFTLDLGQARMIDSAGLNVVVGVLKRVQKLGRKMRVLYSHQSIFRILVFTRLDQHLELVKK